VASIDDLSKRALDTPAGRPAHHLQNESELQIRTRNRETNDFLQALAEMQDQRKYTFASDTIEGIYTTVEHSGYVSAGQRRAINNIRKSMGEEEV